MKQISWRKMYRILRDLECKASVVVLPKTLRFTGDGFQRISTVRINNKLLDLYACFRLNGHIYLIPDKYIVDVRVWSGYFGAGANALTGFIKDILRTRILDENQPLGQCLRLKEEEDYRVYEA